MSQSKNLRSKRKTPIPNEISVTLKTPKSRQYLFSSESITSNQETQYNEVTTQVKRSKRKKLRKTQNFSSFVDVTGNEIDSRNSNDVRKSKLKSSSVSTDSSGVGDVLIEGFNKSIEKPKVKKSKRRKIKLPEVNLDSPGSEDNRSEGRAIKISRKNKKCSSESINSISDDAFSVGLCELAEPNPKRMRMKLPRVNLDDVEIMDDSTRDEHFRRKKCSSIDSISSTSDSLKEDTSEKKVKRKKRSNKANQQDDDVICETRSLRKNQKGKKIESNMEIPYENKENMRIENATIFEDLRTVKTMRQFKNSQLIEDDEKLGKNSRKMSSNSDDDKIEKSRENVELMKPARKKRKLLKSEIITKEIEENIEMQNAKTSRTSRRNLKTSSNNRAEESDANSRIFRNSDQTKVSEENTQLLSGMNSRTSRKTRTAVDHFEDSDENIERTISKNSRTSRKCSETFNSENTDQNQESEENIEILSSKKSRNSRKTSTAVDHSEDSEENIGKPISKNSRTSRKCSETFNSENTDQTEESEENIQILSGKKSRNFRKTSTAVDHFEDLNEKIEKPMSKNSRTSRKCSETFSSENTDQTEESDENIQILSGKKSRNSRKTSTAVDHFEDLDEKIEKPMSKNSKTSRKCSQIYNSKNTYQDQESKENIEILSGKKTRNSRKTSTAVDHFEDSEKSINTATAKLSGTFKKCSNTINSEITDQIEKLRENFETSTETSRIFHSETCYQAGESDENIEMSNLKIFKTSREGSRISNSANKNQTGELEKNNKTSSAKKSRSPRNINTIFNSTFTHETEESNEDLKMPMMSRKRTTASSSEFSDQGDGAKDNFENSAVDEATICNSVSDKFDGNVCKESGNDIIQIHNSPAKRTSKSPFENGKSSTQQGTRKRWTIMTINPKTDLDERDEKRNTSLSINPNGRRSVRKRWSTELKKKLIESKNFSVKEIDESFATIETPKEQFVNTDYNDSINSIPNSSANESFAKSVASTQRENIANCDSPLPPDNCDEDATVGEIQDEVFSCNSGTEDYKNNVLDFSLRRHSKRYSKSLDLLEGISPLERTSTFENAEATLIKDDLQNPHFRKSQTPGSILKRRGTYDLDVSITDVSVLRSLSESNLSNTGLPSDPDVSQGVKKNVRFQHVTVRKTCIKNNGHSDSPGNMLEDSDTQATGTKKIAPKLTAANKSVSFDQSMFSASACPSSTPLHSLRKNTLLKQALAKDESSLSNKKRRSRSVDETGNKFVSRIRMPNFTKIHQRWMDKMEDISQMTERKAERARLLLSGQKPNAQSTSIKNDRIQKKNINEPKHPKQLKFTKYNQLKNTSEKEVCSTLNTKNKNTEESKLRMQDKSNNQPIVGKKNIPKSESVDSKGVFAKTDMKKKPLGIKAKTNQFDDVLKRTEQIKSIATKSKPQHDIREEKRNILKGVRGNRRFELLMKMRNK